MLVTYFGHSTFLIETKGKKLLFDPFISQNSLAKHIDLTKIDCDYILLSHGHADHVYDAEYFAKKCNAPIISNFEIVSWYNKLGIEGVGMNHGGSKSFDFGTVKYVNAVHSSVLPDGTYGGNPGGFVIYNEEGSFYFAGDTALTFDMKLIPMTCPKLSFSILPIGSHFTMDYKDAIIAADFVECNKIIGCHFDTFPPISIQKEIVIADFAANGKEISLINIGDSKEFFI